MNNSMQQIASHRMIVAGLCRREERDVITICSLSVLLAVVYFVRGPRASPQRGDLGLLGPPTGQGASGGARTCLRRVPAGLRADSLATVQPTPRQIEDKRGEASKNSGLLMRNVRLLEDRSDLDLSQEICGQTTMATGMFWLLCSTRAISKGDETAGLGLLLGVRETSQ
ncbi:hypothetical protein PoB_000947600 [Plakobranchus ocellatus]|uniref:Uncharacterized protein n=1 Tax=Plakobranchus ocellatus TaxID=259542 RepID=A0AAV3Y6U1_9GAST|nr:hypothetical protein PoB_000947600 [Plakobranchus ocellatus]